MPHAETRVVLVVVLLLRLQMFYNALKRKGKGDDVSESDAETLVAIHNNMNEVTWNKLLEWEQWHVTRGEVEGDQPKLLRFMGRPFDLTPKAQIKSWLGFGIPFDRHDWTVSRGNGVLQRYVIDYYYDDGQGDDDVVPALGAQETVPIRSILVDVRPAVDNLASIYHRMRMCAPSTPALPPQPLPSAPGACTQPPLVCLSGLCNAVVGRFPGRMMEAYTRGFPTVADTVGPGTGYDKGKEGNYGPAAATASTGLLAKLSQPVVGRPASLGGLGQPAMMEPAAGGVAAGVQAVEEGCAAQFAAAARCAAAAERGEAETEECSNAPLGLNFWCASRRGARAMLQAARRCASAVF